MTRLPASHRFLPRARRQRGQAMTEFVVGTVFFLLPLFLIVPMLGKYADVKSTAAQSARYSAWERTVWYGGASASSGSNWPGNSKTEGEIQNEVRKRVVEFGAALSQNDKSASGFTTAGGRHMWRNRDQSAMLANYNDASGSLTNGDSPDTATADLLGTVTTFTGVLGFSIESKGLYTGNAALRVTTLPIGTNLRPGSTYGRFDPGPLTFRDRNVILANGWGANGRGHVESMTRGIMLLGILGSEPAIADVIEIAGCVAAVFFAPEICMLELSKVVPDVVPPDRLTD